MFFYKKQYNHFTINTLGRDIESAMQSLELEPTALICPSCDQGNLFFDKKLCTIVQLESNKREQAQNQNPYAKYSIGGVLKCLSCKEVVSFCGDINETQLDEYPDCYWITFKYMDPPINLIPIHEKYPEIIRNLLKESFSLYWSHLDSCVNKLRSIIEYLLDDLGISRKTPSGGWISLHNRIKELEKKNLVVIAEYLLAIKWIGNEGSHTDKSLDENGVIFSYDALHKVLDLVYLKSEEQLLEKAKSINLAHDKTLKDNK